jgi:hypothetical protein
MKTKKGHNTVALCHFRSFLTFKIIIYMPCVFFRAGGVIRHLWEKLHSLFHRKDDVPEEIKAALRDCHNMHQLLDFLFSTDFHKDERVLTLFERRIKEIDASCSSTSFLNK